MKYQFTLTFDELSNFHYSNFLKTKNYINVAIIQFYIGLVFANIIYILQFKTFKIHIILLGNIIGILISRKIMKYILKKRIINSFLSKTSQYLFKPTIIFFEDDGIKFENELKEISVVFDSIKRICYIDNYIFLVLQDGKSVLIPIRAFEGIDDKNNFIETLSTSTGLNIEMEFPSDFIYFRRRSFRKTI